MLLGDFSLLLSFFSQICGNFFIFFSLFLFSLFDNEHCIFIADNNLLINFGLLLFFLENSHLLLFLKFFHFMKQDLSLSLLLFSRLKSVNLSGFNLINDNLFSLKSLNSFSFLDFLLFFNFFQSLKLHNLIFFFFLSFEIFPLSFLLF